MSEGSLVKMCRVCGLEFRTNQPIQKICTRPECKKEWKKIYLKLWREAHPNYHRDYMRKYRRIGKEVSLMCKANVAWLVGHHVEALELYKATLRQFSLAPKLNKFEREDVAKCKDRIKQLEARQ